MITRFKIFECVHREVEPGDYVVVKPVEYWKSHYGFPRGKIDLFTGKDIPEEIGKVLNVGTTSIGTHYAEIQFKNEKRSVELRYILYWTEDLNELEAFMNSKKFNV